jgi:hypothetical protein
LFELKIHSKQNRSAKLTDLFELLHEGLKKALDKLKGMYGNEQRRQIYVTIINSQPEIVGGLNTGNYNILTESKKIADYLVNMLENYLQSHEKLQLSDGFKVQFKVLSVDHVDHKVLNSRTFQEHVGSSTERKYPRYISNVFSQCLVHSKGCFVNCCLLLSVIFSIFKALHVEKTDMVTYKKLKQATNRYAVHKKKPTLSFTSK